MHLDIYDKMNIMSVLIFVYLYIRGRGKPVAKTSSELIRFIVCLVTGEKEMLLIS